MSGNITLGDAADLLELIDSRVAKQLAAATERKASVKAVDVQGYVCKIVLQGDPDIPQAQISASFTPQLIPLVGDLVYVINLGGKFRVTRLATSAGFSAVRDAKFSLQLGGASDLTFTGTALNWTDPFTFYDIGNVFQLPTRQYVRLDPMINGTFYPVYTSGDNISQTNYSAAAGIAFQPGARLFVSLDFDAIRNLYATNAPLTIPGNYVIINDSYTGRIPDNFFLLAWLEVDVTDRSQYGVATYGPRKYLRSGVQPRLDVRDSSDQLTINPALTLGQSSEKLRLTRQGNMRFLTGLFQNNAATAIAASTTILTIPTLDQPQNSLTWGHAVLLTSALAFSSVTGAKIGPLTLSLPVAIPAASWVSVKVFWRVGGPTT